jgi:hypothetical protein
MELNIKQAAGFSKVSRSTIYAKIASGELSKSVNGMLDTSELLRVFGSPKDTTGIGKATRLDDTKDTKLEADFLRDKVKMLESSLSDAKDREEWLKGQISTLTDTMKLLEAPKPPFNTPPNLPKPEKRGFLSRFGAK